MPAEVLVIGRIATLAGDAGPGWVEAVGIAGGRVVAAGRLADVEAVAGARTRRLRLEPGETAIPGLTDAHLHLAEASLARRRVNLEGLASIDALVAAVRSAAAAQPHPDTWIEGAGWDADTLGRWPTAEDLERAAPGRRIALWAHDHHALLASTRALAQAGIDAGTADPEGGVIRRDAAGAATGVLHEAAARLATSHIPPPDGPTVAAALRPLIDELLALGVVAVHDPGGLADRRDLAGPIEAYRSLAAAGRLAMRVHACVRAEQLEAAGAEGLRSGAPLGPDPLDRLHLGWLKTFADGSLGSRTAALLEPLAVRPGETRPPNDGYGVWVTPPQELAAQVSRATSLGIATQVHAIGDAAVRAALDALAPGAGVTALMPRVEHAQFVDPEDVPRFAALGIAASVQPVHVRSDAGKARALWGARGEAHAYPAGALDRAGAVLAFGTDAPVEPVDPWPGLECAVTRAAPTWPPGTAPYGIANGVPLWRAIRAACVDPAVTAGEHDRGRLTVGQRADLVVVPAAALVEPVEAGGALWQCRPRLVLLDGKVVAGG